MSDIAEAARKLANEVRGLGAKASQIIEIIGVTNWNVLQGRANEALSRAAPWNDPTVRWVCEEHPDKDFPHDDCPGPGMMESEALASQPPPAEGEIADDINKLIEDARHHANHLVLSASDGSESYTDYRASKGLEDALVAIKAAFLSSRSQEGREAVIEECADAARRYVDLCDDDHYSASSKKVVEDIIYDLAALKAAPTETEK